MTQSFSLPLPLPPTLNNLFINLQGRGRVPSKSYKDWRKRADETLWTNHVKAIGGPVKILLMIEDKGRRDLDNCAKAVIDFLVQHNLIDGDDRKVVRRIVLEWGDIEGAIVEVHSFP